MTAIIAYLLFGFVAYAAVVVAYVMLSYPRGK